MRIIDRIGYKIEKWCFKTIYFVLFFALFFTLISCGNKSKTAKDYFMQAEGDYLSGNYESAKSNIDSIKILYPKAFKEIREGFDLMQDVRKAENKRNIVFIDSMIDANIIKLKELQLNFDFVRDENYQEFGNYIPKLTPISQSLNSNNLRSGVSERGILFLESVLVGSNLNHNKIKVSIPDGSYAESLVVTSDGLNYKFATIEKSYEIVRFFGSDENGVSEFIYTFQNSPITLTYLGKKNMDIVLPNSTKTAVAQSFELSKLLYEIEDLKFEKGKSETLLRYLEKGKETSK